MTTTTESHTVRSASLSLPQYPLDPTRPAVDRYVAPVVLRSVNGEPPGSRFAGDPFSPFKILNHLGVLQAVVRGETAPPVTVEIDPTNVCNHRCQWCVSTMSHNGEQFTLEQFVRLIGDIARLGAKSVVLKGGGEPTLHKQFNAMMRKVADAGLAPGVITNGTMPWPDTPRILLETADWVRISLDAATAETHRLIHGARDFQRIVRNISFLTENARRTLVGLNFVAEPRNHREIRDFAKLGRSLGAAYVAIRCVFDPTVRLDRAVREEMRRQIEAAKSLADEGFRVLAGNFSDAHLDAGPDRPFPYRRCLGPNLVGIIGGDGEVFACCFLRGNPAFSLGNVHRQGFDEIWASDHRREVMQRADRGDCGRICMGIGGLSASRYHLYNELLDYLTLKPKAHADFA
jgi:MoaA/NifB/PqqE/SkfB family radical SAM enzyme